MVYEEKVLEKLEFLIKINAANLAYGKGLNEQVRILSSVGLKPKEIADILDKSPNHISVILNALKKRGTNEK